MYKQIRDTVQIILEEDEKARNNDKYLIYQVLNKVGLPTDLKDLANANISLESITRSRRDLQARFPHLRPCQEVEAMRGDMTDDILANVLDRGPANG